VSQQTRPAAATDDHSREKEEEEEAMKSWLIITGGPLHSLGSRLA